VYQTVGEIPTRDTSTAAWPCPHLRVKESQSNAQQNSVLAAPTDLMMHTQYSYTMLHAEALFSERFT
jgi:hypothetical protein